MNTLLAKYCPHFIKPHQATGRFSAKWSFPFFQIDVGLVSRIE